MLPLRILGVLEVLLSGGSGCISLGLWAPRKSSSCLRSLFWADPFFFLASSGRQNSGLLRFFPLHAHAIVGVNQALNLSMK